MTKYQQDKAQYNCEWFTSWFREVLDKKRISQNVMAVKTGLSCRTVESYRTGERSPNLKTFLLILDKLGLEMRITEKQ